MTPRHGDDPYLDAHRVRSNERPDKTNPTPQPDTEAGPQLAEVIPLRPTPPLITTEEP